MQDSLQSCWQGCTRPLQVALRWQWRFPQTLGQSTTRRQSLCASKKKTLDISSRLTGTSNKNSAFLLLIAYPTTQSSSTHSFSETVWLPTSHPLCSAFKPDYFHTLTSVYSRYESDTLVGRIPQRVGRTCDTDTKNNAICIDALTL